MHTTSVRRQSGRRQAGLITGLITDALESARRGLDVAFWSATMVSSRDAFRRACDLAADDTEVERLTKANGEESVQYKSGGRVRFLCSRVHGRRGFTADLELVDEPSRAIVIADTLRHARQIAAQRGHAIAASPRSIKSYHATRGICVSEILVDDSVWPLADDVLAELAPHRAPIVRLSAAQA
ncbi:hypothetical protein [Mycolicibacterium mageritense]|uniref:hypothetical protein n=1 Tax=Mycolicibacterium mageritense TaxID=53462 RepID=UPI001E3CE81B|nr:hypothetical protein [Mycolicibacterium mageritense]